MEQNIYNIPKEKFAFVDGNDLLHDKKLSTKPRSYMRDALSRFAKNKGAIVGAVIILILVLMALFAPFITEYSVSYANTYFTKTYPKCKLFENTSFWDGCQEKKDSKSTFMYYYAMGLETKHNAVKNQKFTETEDEFFIYRLDTYHKNGMIYQNLEMDEFEALQQYQNDTGIQVMYPTLKLADRPQAQQDQRDANYYFKTTGMSKTKIVYDEEGNIIPVYWKQEEGKATVPYNSLRIEGEEGIQENGKTYFYTYARKTSSGVEVRVNYYEYYIYEHTMILKDGITEPYFLFGTTSSGQDIFTCLFSGARFSFIFAIIVAAVNLFVGAIYGSIAGYYGGKVDLVMERISDILSAIPSMIVITLLKLNMKGQSDVLILFLSFFATGWIGMAGTTRMQFYRYKNQEYVLAARTLGANDRRIIWKHIFPNALGTLVTSCALVIPSMIYSETNLTYLGIINLSTGDITSVGTLIAAGQASLATTPFIAMFPAVFLALLMLSFNLFGNGLRDAFNPSLRGAE